MFPFGEKVQDPPDGPITVTCSVCGEDVHVERSNEHETRGLVCDDCFVARECDSCGELFPPEDIDEDDLCLDCRE